MHRASRRLIPDCLRIEPAMFVLASKEDADGCSYRRQTDRDQHDVGPAECLLKYSADEWSENRAKTTHCEFHADGGCPHVRFIGSSREIVQHKLSTNDAEASHRAAHNVDPVLVEAHKRKNCERTGKPPHEEPMTRTIGAIDKVSTYEAASE